MDATIKKIPYGMTNFESIICDNYYYVDKTHYITKVENTSRFFFFVRPRRFGKSLFLSMLSHYYDINQKDKFDKIFGELYIGKHPTPDRNKYLVLALNFSSVASSMERLEESFNTYCKIVMTGFAERNAHLLGEEAVEKLRELKTGDALLGSLCQSANSKGQKIYLILDEYDNFANNILVDYGNERYRSITHGSGFFRGFLKVVKDYSNSVIERIFLTGVSPVTMDDLTSGFNIAANYSNSPTFNNMMGFNEQEVRTLIDYYKSYRKLPHTTNELIDIMKPWYDNYCFAEESLERDPKMFNCDMVFYYLRHYITLGKSPKEMIDPNTRMDYNKMKKLIQLDRLDGNRKGVLRKITEEGQIVTALTTTFPATEIANPEIFPSLLFYYGMLTITATRGQRMVLSIPNNNVRKQYYEFMLEEYQERRYIDLNSMLDLFYDMAYDGHWRESLEFIAHAYKENSSVRSAIEGERNIQGFFTAYLSVNAYYLLAPELELNHGFCDLFLMPDLLRYEVAHSYIIELKYLSSKDSESKTETQWQEAVGQVRMYAAAPKVKQLIQNTQLHCIVVQFRGCELERMEEVSF